MLVSVIIPVYNTEQYLPACLDSVICQTYQEIEIILVDDGSTDRSLEICTDYAKRDSRILVVQGEHQGLVAARKRGTQKSSGQYCMFVDSDDWIAENLVESVLSMSENGTIDLLSYSTVSIEGSRITQWSHTVSEGKYEKERLKTLHKKMMFDFNAGCPGVIQSLWTKLIKRELLEKSVREVEDGITMGEDAAVVYQALLLAKTVVITNDSFYFYRIHETSMCHAKDPDIFSKIYRFRQYMTKVFEAYEEEYGLKEQLQAYLLLLIRIGLRDIFSVELRDLYHIPFDLDVGGKKLILYGAGAVGKSYYRQLRQLEKIELVAWIDRGLQNRYIYDYKIQAPEDLSRLDFDKILIAVKNREMAMEIKSQLGKVVPEEKILWGEPRIYWWEKEIEL